MDWQEVDAFKVRIGSIEAFFVEIAANEELLSVYGFNRALNFPSAEEALEALETFTGDFSALRRYMSGFDERFADELEKLETIGNLIEQVGLISLRVRMAAIRKPSAMAVGAMFRAVWLMMAIFLRVVRKSDLFDETTVSLHRTIVNLQRLSGITRDFGEYTKGRILMDDAIFRPSRIKPAHVVKLIDVALTEIEIELAPRLNAGQLEILRDHLARAKEESLSPKPVWPKVVGALVIVAAITSGIADAPNATKTIKEVIGYIIGTSVQEPTPESLPLPEIRQPVDLPQQSET